VSQVPGHAPELGGTGFYQSRACFAETAEWLAGPEAAALTHAGLEEQLDARVGSCCGGCTKITWTCGRRASSAGRR
jgi:hypothetical protein